MAIYIYRLSDGTLYSYCPNDTDPVASASVLAANGLAAKVGLSALSSAVGWNPATQNATTLNTVTLPAPPVSGSIVFNGVTYSISGTT